MNFEPCTGELKTLIASCEFVHLELERRKMTEDMFLKFNCSAPLAFFFKHRPRVNKGYLFIYLFISVFI